MCLPGRIDIWGKLYDREQFTKQSGRFARQEHQKERETLFSNESFAIGVLQAVSGGSLFAALAQSGTLVALAGRVAFLMFITLMGAGLISAVCAAYWRHQYKMWDVKARVADTVKEAAIRGARSSRHLRLMRFGMLAALLTFVFGLVELLWSAWAHVLQTGAN